MRFFTYLLALFAAVFLTACGGGGGASGAPSGSSSPLTTSAPSTLTVAVGAAYQYTILGGKAPYQVSSSSPQISVGSVNDSNLTISGVATGTSSIVITDAKLATTTIAVTVSNLATLYTTAPTTINLSPASSATYTIGGGVPGYTVSSTDTRIASASTNGSNLTINSSAIGAATLTIRDANGQTIQLAVVVGNLVALYTTAPNSLIVAKDTQRSFIIGGGAPGYSVESTDSRIADATVSGATLLITAKAVGSTVLVIRDTTSGGIALSITVGGASTLGLYTSAPSSLTVAKGTNSTYSIGGGAGGYTVAISDSRIATVTLSGNTFSVNAIALGKTDITVRDAAGVTLTISVTVASASPDAFSTTAPSAFSMSAGTTLTYGVSGGASPYSVASTDARVITGSISGSTLTVTALKAGTAALQLVDAAGKVLPVVVTADGGSPIGATSPASIDIQASANTLASAPGSKVNFVVTVKDAVNAAMPNQVVTFTATSGTLTGTSPAPSTDANGAITTISLSPGADATNRTITVTATAGGISKSINIPVVGSTLSVAGAGSALVGNPALTYSVKALESAGKPIVGATLTVTSSKGNTIAPAIVTTDLSGTATFGFTPVVPGTDTLTVTGLGTTATTVVAVSNEDFAFTAPATAAQLLVNTGNTVSVCYKVSTVVTPPTSAVTFSTTRGSLSVATYPDAQGCTSATVSSPTAGPVTVSAQMGTVRSSVTAAFIATVPATIVLQANPGAVLPNAAGSTSNQSTLLATVLDATGNPVTNQVVNFTAVADLSSGSIVPGTGTTDANGQTSVQFIPGALSTAANGVTVRATVQSNPALTSDATLTVNGNALFIAIGVASTLAVPDAVTYKKQFSVYVTDANGAPAANRAVTVSVYPDTYGKGRLVYDKDLVPARWTEANPSATCVNEDRNRNGIFDSADVDQNTNGRLEPGLPIVISPSSVTTDASGNATFYMSYGKNYAWWLSTQITARASVGGTESSKMAAYDLEMLAADAQSVNTPPNQASPFGTSVVDPTATPLTYNGLCTNPN